MSANTKYLLSERIAQGGMAEIWLGRVNGSDDEFQKICAFKRILPEYTQDDEFMAMFRNEAMVAKLLQHKNIVQVYDFDTEDSRNPMLVMEYVDGTDLRLVLAESEKKKQFIPIEICVFVCMEILNGLAYAHTATDLSGKSLGIIHRDISPQNILMGFEGEVKVTDFGIAKIQSSVSHTRVGVLKGKFRYMSPEQAAGNELDCRTDIFSVGVVLWEMLTMNRLFRGENDVMVLETVRKCEIKPPNSIKGVKIPQALEDIVMKLLEKDTAKRYLTSKDAAKDLTKFVYSYKNDFHYGELADFMQKLMPERMTRSKERLRSTMALPEAGKVPSFMDIIGSMKNGGQLNKSAPSHIGADDNDKKTFEQAPYVPQSVKHEKLEVMISPGTSGKDFNSSGTRTGARSIKRPSVPLRATGQSARYISRKKIGFEAIVGTLAVVLVLTILVLLVSLKLKYIEFSSELELNITPVNKVQLEIDGNMYMSGTFISTPVNLKFKEGKHKLTIKRLGFKHKTIFFNASLLGIKSKEVVILESDSTMGVINFTTTPSGASIIVENGLEVGTTPVTLEFLPIGKTYRISVNHPSCREETLTEYLPSYSATKGFNKHVTLSGCGK